MSQVITKRVRLSRRAIVERTDCRRLADSRRACRRWFRCSIRAAPRMPPDTPPARRREKAIESRFVLWFNGNGIPERYWIPSTKRAPTIAMTPCLSPLAPFRNDFHVLSGLDNAAANPGHGQRSPQLDERAHDVHALHRARPERSLHRPGDRRQDRRRIAIPLAADRRLAGIVRREHAAQHELGRVRARAAAGDDPAQALRPPVRRTRRRLGEPQAEHPGRSPPGCRPR